jgi:hypothetical protein
MDSKCVLEGDEGLVKDTYRKLLTRPKPFESSLIVDSLLEHHHAQIKSMLNMQLMSLPS